MKIIKLFLIGVLFIAIDTQAQLSWQNIGKAGFSPDIDRATIGVDGADTIYTMFTETNKNQVTVMKFNGTDWEVIGRPRFSGYLASSLDIAFDNSIPYVIYSDNGGNVNVRKYNYGNWIAVGDTGFTKTQSNSIAIGKDGTPYIAFSDRNDSLKISVMRYINSQWELVGKKGFSNDTTQNTQLILGKNDTPFVVFQDYAHARKITVMKYNGNQWVSIGTPGFSINQVDFTTISISNNGVPYVAFMDFSKNQKATVMKFNGQTWEIIGNSGFSSGQSYNLNIVLDKNDIPYVSFSNNFIGKANVMQFNGTSWVSVGLPDFSLGGIDYSNMVIDRNGTPYIGYKDESFTPNGKMVVMKYAPSSSLNELRVNNSMLTYPNPAKDQVYIFYKSPKQDYGSVTILDFTGNTIVAQDISPNTSNPLSIEIKGLTKGIYFIRLQFGSDILTSKLIIEP